MTFRVHQVWFVVVLAVMLCLTATYCNPSLPTPEPTAMPSATAGMETHPTTDVETRPTATVVPATPTPSPTSAPSLTRDGLHYISLGCCGGNGYSPIAVAEDADLKRIYVYNSYNDEDGQDTLSVVSANTLEVIDTVRLGGNQTVPSLTSQLLVDNVTHRVYALNGDSRALLILDGDTLDILFIVHGATRIALAPTNGRLYLTNQVGQIKSLSASDYSSLGSLNWEANFEPSNIAYNPVNDGLYLSRWDFSQRGTMVVLDGTTLAQRLQITLSSAPYDLQVDAQSNMIYAATDTGITIIDGNTNTIAHTLNLDIANFNPSRSMTLDSEKKRLYLSHNWGVSLASGGELIIIDTETRSVVSRVRTGHYWRNLAFSPQKDMLYAVPTQNESLLLVGTDGQILNRVMLGLQLLAIQSDPRTGQLWAVDSAGSIHVLSRPPGMETVEKRTDVIGTLDGATEKAELIVTENSAYVTDRARGRSVSLDKGSLEIRQKFQAAGPLAVDEPGQRLFIVAGNVYIYGLGTGKPLQEIALPAAGDESPAAVGILYDPVNDRIYLKMRSGINSSVNYRTFWRLYNGKTKKYITAFNPDKRDVTGIAIAPEPNRLYLSYSGASDWDKGLITYDLGGVELDRLRGLNGQLALSGDSQYLYILRPSGLWVLDRATMNQLALWPLSEAYKQMVIDRDNQWLYLWNGPRVAVLSVEELLRKGIQSPQKLPESMGLPATTYRSPRYETDGLVYALAPSEGVYVSSDRGQTWHLSNQGLKDLYVAELIFSDDFAADGAVWIKTATGGVYRSNDRGKTWQRTSAWTPTIAFVSMRGGSSGVYLTNSDGSQTRRITEEGINAQNPHWAPEDNWICFDSNHEGNSEIYVIQPDGYGLARLTSDAAEDTDPVWSPVGDRIAFVSTRDGNPEIYLMEADGANPIRLTANSAIDRQPAWSPDGTRLAFTSNRDGQDAIYILAWETGEITRLTAGDGQNTQPAWSPDGQWIAFVSDRHGDLDIFRVRPDGTELAQITDASAAEQFPAWAPDSNTLVIASDRTGTFQLYEMNLYGRNWRRLTMDAYTNTAPAWVHK